MTLTLIDLLVVLAVIGGVAYLVCEYVQAQLRRPRPKDVVNAALKPDPPPQPDPVADLKALLSKPKPKRSPRKG